jgi:hypothetical protein
MMAERDWLTELAMSAAVVELKDLIRRRHPEALFQLGEAWS